LYLISVVAAATTRYIYRLLIGLRNHLIGLVGFERTPIRFRHDGMTHKYPRRI